MNHVDQNNAVGEHRLAVSTTVTIKRLHVLTPLLAPENPLIETPMRRMAAVSHIQK